MITGKQYGSGAGEEAALHESESCMEADGEEAA